MSTCATSARGNSRQLLHQAGEGPPRIGQETRVALGFRVAAWESGPRAAQRWMTGPARIQGGTSRAEPGTRGGTAQGRLYGEADRVKDGAQGRPAEPGLAPMA